MLSLELSRELKDAGLVWEPKAGDFASVLNQSLKQKCH